MSNIARPHRARLDWSLSGLGRLRLPQRGVAAVKQLRHDRNVERLTAHFAHGAAGVDQAQAYAHLTPFSLAASGIAIDRRVGRRLTVVLPELRPGAMFAGVRTAVEVAVELAATLDLPLRLVVLWAAPRGPAADQVRNFLVRELGSPPDRPVTLLAVDDLVGEHVHPDDLWMVTHWSTAHPVEVACRLGVLRAEQVLYLVQDYEPGFSPWSSDFALARSTYHAGFTMIVNSTPLRAFLADAEGIEVRDDRVFAPRLDLARLSKAASTRRPSPVSRIMFYGRPSRPRNLFDIGLAAIRLAAHSLVRNGVSAQFVSAGEEFPSVELARDLRLDVRGKMAWPDYFTLLAETDVVVSLQHSPHPSHPPLDAVVSGAWAVSNDLGDTRGGLHERLLVAEPDPAKLAESIVAAAASARDTASPYDESVIDRLGRPLALVLASASTDLDSSVCG